ncbi:MAG: hypothetical protein NT130_01710 [Candidatus Micrarchaeota archaeon]|nr:hypothetical protein [Candidatus Micrarchaeota archaeon]
MLSSAQEGWGEQVVHELAKNAYIDELLLIERTRDRAEGIRKDLVDEDPGYEEKLRRKTDDNLPDDAKKKRPIKLN